MIRRTVLVLILTFGAYTMMSVEPEDAAAQIRVGGHGGYNFDVEEGLVGADFWIGIYSITDTIQLHGNVSFHWYFTGELFNLWSLDLNAPILFKLGTDIVRPYAGIGVGVFHFSFDSDLIDGSETNFAFNMFGGALFLPETMFNPYVQFRYYLSESNGGELIGGILFKF